MAGSISDQGQTFNPAPGEGCILYCKASQSNALPRGKSQGSL